MKNVIVGTALFIGGTFTGFKVCQKVMITTINSEKFRTEAKDRIEKALMNAYGEEKYKKAMGILEGKEV